MKYIFVEWWTMKNSSNEWSKRDKREVLIKFSSLNFIGNPAINNPHIGKSIIRALRRCYFQSIKKESKIKIMKSTLGLLPPLQLVQSIVVVVHWMEWKVPARSLTSDNFIISSLIPMIQLLSCEENQVSSTAINIQNFQNFLQIWDKVRQTFPQLRTGNHSL